MWSGIACIAGALERKVWVRTNSSNLYPNLYTVLVAGPGIGKTITLSKVEELWRALPDHHVAPTSVTKASLMDSIADAKRNVLLPGQSPPYLDFNSLLVLAGELGVLIPGYDNEFMNALTAIYDGYPYAERRRSKDLKLEIPCPQLNLFGATTPSYLNAVMPEGAWDQGFISRTILVYSGDRIIRPLFMETTERPELKKALLEDLKKIGDYIGKLAFDTDAAAFVSDWHVSGGPPIPDHPKLVHYLTRRTTHLLKLCMVSAVSRADFNYIVTRSDAELALHWLLQAESAMPDIFRSMTGGGDSRAMDELWHYVFTVYSKEKKPVSEHRLVMFLRERVPSHNVMKIIDIMVKSQLIRLVASDAGAGYAPAPRLPS